MLNVSSEHSFNVSRRALGNAELLNFLKANKKLKLFFLRKLESTSDKNPFGNSECLLTTNRANISRFRLLRSHLP